MNGIGWFQIGVSDAQTAHRFYGDLFGWTFAEDDAYQMITTPDEQVDQGRARRRAAGTLGVLSSSSRTCRGSAGGRRRPGARCSCRRRRPTTGSSSATVTDPEGNHFGIFRASSVRERGARRDAARPADGPEADCRPRRICPGLAHLGRRAAGNSCVSSPGEGMRRRNGLRRPHHRRLPGLSRSRRRPAWTSTRRRSTCCAGGRSPIYEPFLDELLRRGGAQPDLHDRLRRGCSRRRGRVRRRADAVHCPTAARTCATCEWRRRASARRSGRRVHRRGQQVDRADRQRQLGRRRSCASRSSSHRRRPTGDVRGRVQPGVPARGLGDPRHALPGPHRDRLGRPAQPRRAQPALPADAQPVLHGADVPAAPGRHRRGAADLDRPRLGRADQVRGQRVPGAEDQLHQRDRPARREGRRRHQAGRPGHRPGRADRLAVPAARHRLGRVLLRQGHRRADRDRRRVRARHADRARRPARSTSASASVVVDKLLDELQASSRAARSACWAWRSSPTPTTCATLRRSTSPGC